MVPLPPAVSAPTPSAPSSSPSASSTAVLSRSPSRSRKVAGARTGRTGHDGLEEELAGRSGLCRMRRDGGKKHHGREEVGVAGRQGRGGPAAARDSTAGDWNHLPRRTRAFSRSFWRRKQDSALPPPPAPLDEEATIDCARWMSFLPDSARLDELYLPGTHESLALHFPLLGSMCQSSTLTTQLNGGIRFLDLRFSLLRSRPLRFTGRTRELESAWELWAYHGPLPQLRRAEDVFEEVYAWLKSEQGRRETVVVSCKQENATPSSVFASTLWALLDRRQEFWYDKERWPSLGEVRGKCVMFCRFGFDSRRGLHPPIWPNDSSAAWKTEIGRKEVVVQDWYGLPSVFAVPQKASLALSLFDPSSPALLALSSSPSSSEPSIPPRINFLSSASFPLAPPSLCAKGFGWPRWRLGFYGVNALFHAGLRRAQGQAEKTGEERRGMRYEEGQGGMVVMLDFWEEPRELVPSIVSLNFP